MGMHSDEPSSPVLPVTSPILPVISPKSPVISPKPPEVASLSPVTSLAPSDSPLMLSRSPEIDIVSMRHGVTVTKIPKGKTGVSEISKVPISLASRSKMEDPTEQGDLTSVVKQTQRLSLGKPCVLHKRLEKDSKKIIDKKGETVSKEKSEVSVSPGVVERLDAEKSVSEDSLKDIGEKVLDKAEYHVRESVDTEQSSDERSTDSVEYTLSSETESAVTDAASTGNDTKIKETKKRKIHSLLPALKRSQSVGCETKLAVDASGNLIECPERQVCPEQSCDASDASRRVIHKTCSADAAMMVSDVLPIDPQEFVKVKQKSSIARNMRKKLQKLKRRNTDSLLGAAIMTVRGTTKITQSDAMQWAASFDSLLADKNGLDMFHNFLKSEFSEENIEFWIACEEFKTVRTNKLFSRAHKIYSDFIATNAPRQVNLDSKTRLETVTNLENPTRDLFKQAQKRIQFLMENDSYQRFLNSDTYKQLIRRYSQSDGR